MRLYIAEIQPTKLSTVGADVVRKTSTSQQNLQVCFEKMEPGSPRWRLPPPSPTDPKSPWKVHSEMYLFAHMVLFITQISVVIELQLVAFIQSKTAKQLSWLLNQIVEATWIKITELDLKVTVKHIARKPIYLFCFDYETCYIRFIARVAEKISAKFQENWPKMFCVHDNFKCSLLTASSGIHRTSFY